MSANDKRELFQSVGTALALLVSVMALVVSIYEANLLKSQQRASLWPYLSLGELYNSEGFGLELENKGTGPAIIQSVEVRYNDTLVRTYDQLFDMAKPDRELGYDYLRTSKFNESVISRDEALNILFIPRKKDGYELADRVREVEITVCYCSVMEDCWVIEYPSGDRRKGRFKAQIEFEN